MGSLPPEIEDRIEGAEYGHDLRQIVHCIIESELTCHSKPHIRENTALTVGDRESIQDRLDKLVERGVIKRDSQKCSGAGDLYRLSPDLFGAGDDGANRAEDRHERDGEENRIEYRLEKADGRFEKVEVCVDQATSLGLKGLFYSHDRYSGHCYSLSFTSMVLTLLLYRIQFVEAPEMMLAFFVESFIWWTVGVTIVSVYGLARFGDLIHIIVKGEPWLSLSEWQRIEREPVIAEVIYERLDWF